MEGGRSGTHDSLKVSVIRSGGGFYREQGLIHICSSSDVP